MIIWSNRVVAFCIALCDLGQISPSPSPKWPSCNWVIMISLFMSFCWKLLCRIEPQQNLLPKTDEFIRSNFLLISADGNFQHCLWLLHVIRVFYSSFPSTGYVFKTQLVLLWIEWYQIRYRMILRAKALGVNLVHASGIIFPNLSGSLMKIAWLRSSKIRMYLRHSL